MSVSESVFLFNVDGWSANSSKISSEERWVSWSHTLVWDSDENARISSVPAMMRRRMSHLSKITVQVASELLSRNDVDYLVFSSRHGELHRSVKLLEDIIRGEELSPIFFSQSVHNTAAGLTTIAAKKALPLTSVSAGTNTFFSALTEAWLYLAAHPQHKVLLVDFDEPVPEVYGHYESESYHDYAFGLVLSSGNRYSVQHCGLTGGRTELTQGLEFLRNYLSGQREWMIPSHDSSLLFLRNDV